MPGGLIQLVGMGAQNQFVNGNPSMTYFSVMYKRFTNFAMEHFQLNFRGTDLNLSPTLPKVLRCKVPRYADLLHDCYICVNLPDIYSPLSINTNGTSATAYEFQWIPNIGYNMIDTITLNMNGTSIVTMTGEWMKLYTYLKYNATQRRIIDEMVGNTPNMYDPANGAGRTNQYPNAIQLPGGLTPAPSIPGRQLNIPLSFWFCQEIGQSLPLVALTESEVEIVVTFRTIYDLFTVIDVRNTSPTYGQRIPGIPQDNVLGMQNFLSPPLVNGDPSQTALQNWNLNPYVEANFIFLTETERAHVAGYEKTFLITQPRWVATPKQYGYNDILIPMFNLCTRVVAVFQRTDLALNNQWDNYTNWTNARIPQIDQTGVPIGPLVFYTSGVNTPTTQLAQDILQEGHLVFDGADRFDTKNTNFFRLIENFQYSGGDTTSLPGIYQYSFALDPNDITQPSGAANGSMFNKTNLQYTLRVPPVTSVGTQTGQCVVKSTVFNPVPTPVPTTATIPPAPGLPANYQPGDTLYITNPIDNNGMPYQYNGIIYVEAYNFLKVTSGQANLVFST